LAACFGDNSDGCAAAFFPTLADETDERAMKRLLLLVATSVLMLSPGAARPSAQTNALSFFKNYFVTGDYVVGGVGLNGTGQGQIAITGVPSQSADTDIVAAYLYWQVVASSSAGPDAGALGVTFRGYPLSGIEGAYGKQLGTGSATCSTSGGGTGGSNGSKLNYSYRADVLRFFDVAPAAPLGNGKTVVNGVHSVTVPVRNGIEPLGASLVVVYRDPTRPLSAIVLYDGSYTMNQANESMLQTLKGFYQSGTSAKITHIVGSGQANKSEILYYNGAPLATNPFTSALGGQWDNPTFNLASPAGQSQVTTSVDHQGFSTFDCLNWSAIVYRTTVQDTDDDGLLDVWETATLSAPIYDPNGQALPALGAMGANPNQKDLFIEIGHMKTDLPTSYGGVLKPAHSHLPPPAALKLMGDALTNAPLGKAINVHFDVGDSYEDPSGEAIDYVIRGAGLARGGEAINESITVQCTPGASPWDCQYQNYPGTVGWKSGFRFLRDEVTTTPPAGVDCDAPGSACERRFDRNRFNIFHYALFAHAVGLPVSELPCLDASGSPVQEGANDQCTTGVVNPQFQMPRTNTGVGDFPGGDMLVTLGAFPDVSGLPVGTPFMQASTLMHEFGHNAERRHGGDALEPNCKPTYLSAMNYLYQLRGLPDNFGKPHLNFSSGSVGTQIDEAGLTDGVINNVPYRLGWYAKLADSYLAGKASAAARHCDGSAVLPGESFVRIDARTSTGVIDWNANGAVDTNFALDVNFNGRTNTAMLDKDDWSNLRLNQIGARRNIGGLLAIPGSTQFAVGPLSLDVGKGDLGKGDLGKGDLGKGDLGKGDLGKGDLGKGDLGKGDLGKGDLGKGDLGGGDLFTGDPNNPGGELDFETAGDLAKAPPNEFRACVIGVDSGCTGTTQQFHRVRVQWTAPNVGGVASYSVFRVASATLSVGQTWDDVGSAVPAVLGQAAYTTVDDSQLTNGASYTYFAVANYADIRSDPSNLVTITAVNDPAVAGNDTYSTNEDTPLTVPAPGVLGNDGDPDSPGLTFTAQVGTGPATGTGTVTVNPDGSFVYTPAANFNGTASFTYTASDGTTTTNAATVTVTVNAVNDAPAAVANSYSTAEDTALTVAATGVLGNDSDIEGSALSAALVTGTANGALSLNASGAFTYTPAPNFNGTDSFTYKANDGTVDSNVVTVAITVTSVNDPPTISDIVDRTIDWSTNTGALTFTIGDVDGLTGVSVTGASSNPTLAPPVNIVFGGSGATRNVTVTPTANQSGTATITVTVRDAGGLQASDTFLLTVRRVEYTFVGLQNIPPPAGKTFKAGSSIPLGWQYQNGTTVVDSSMARFEVTVVGPLPNPTVNNTDSGQSSFRYSGGAWSFNLQTKNASGTAFPVGTYQVTVKSLTAGFRSSAPFTVNLVK